MGLRQEGQGKVDGDPIVVGARLERIGEGEFDVERPE
ncbi:unannotated protein [freshwater metagenome]|uniref:Unannotated protein n=1 Tax=freshwater metagenome TaxID=449393 RepID=A0A6J7BZS8_9ZZZZ